MKGRKGNDVNYESLKGLRIKDDDLFAEYRDLKYEVQCPCPAPSTCSPHACRALLQAGVTRQSAALQQSTAAPSGRDRRREAGGPLSGSAESPRHDTAALQHEMALCAASVTSDGVETRVMGNKQLRSASIFTTRCSGNVFIPKCQIILSHW